MKKSIIAICITIIAYCFACSPEQLHSIDPEFDPYVDLFFTEAQKRGFNISRDDFTFSIAFGNGFRSGVCYTRENRIVINKNYWHTLSELTKQYLIFHEMGHCILERPHDNQVLANGECKSLMKGDEENECRFNIDNFNIWREYYLDELFEESTALPPWYINTLVIREAETLYETVDTLSRRIFLIPDNLDPEADVLLEANFKSWNKTHRATLRIDDIKIVCSNNAISILTITDDLRYLKQNLFIQDDTKISLIRKDGLYYYLLDDQIFHIEDQLDIPWKDIRMELVTGISTTVSPAILSMKLSLID